MQKKASMIFGIVGGVCVLSVIALKILEQGFGITLFVLGMTTWGINGILAMVAILSLAVLAVRLLRVAKKRAHSHKALFTAGIVVVVCLTLIGVPYAWLAGFITEPRYFTFSSPDGAHTIVVEEESFLLAGFGSVYKKENALFMSKKAGYSTDDGYRPFSANDYRLTWGQANASLTYGFGAMGLDRSVEIPF